MTENILKQIYEKLITLALTLDEAFTLRHVLEKWETAKGIPTDMGCNNKCPMCDHTFTEGDNYCPHCGQKVEFVNSDVIPL